MCSVEASDSERLPPAVKLQEVLKDLSEGVVVTDTEMRIKYVNRRACQILGIDSTSLGLPFSEVVGHDATSRKLRRIISTAGRWTPAGKPETLNVTVSGREQYFKISVSPLYSGEELDGAVILLNDITHYKRVDRLKTQFVATVSHEFRNPLTSIVMAAELLFEGKDEGERDKLINAIREDGQRLIRLVDNLMELARIEEGQIPIRMESVEISEMVAAALGPLQFQIKEKEIELCEKIPASLPEVYVDATKATWILTNLVGNAIRYTPRGGRITVSAVHKYNKIYVSVTDTGYGIPNDYHEKIFEKFAQVKGNAQGGGAGLGLAIAKEIVEAHGGRIWVDSRITEGARFTFTLPVMQKEGFDEENTVG